MHKSDFALELGLKMELIVSVLLLIVGCSARPNGAPKSACSSMTPYHDGGIERQTSNPPYVVTATKSGENVRVKIYSPYGEEFKGFMMQARSKNDKRRHVEGTFSRSQVSKAMDCFNGKENTLTHVDPKAKTEVITDWTPSSGVNEEVIFRVTVAKTYDLFWTDIDSSPLKIETGGRGGLHSNAGSNSGRMPTNSHPMYDGCSTNKGCFGYPDGCTETGDCEVMLSFAKVSDGILYRLHGFLDSSEYMAMGLSTDDRMGDDSVTQCHREDSSIRARRSYNLGKRNINATDIPRDSYEGSLSDGLSTCSWMSPFLTQLNGRTYDLEQNAYHVLLAKGRVSNGNIGYHAETRINSAEPIDFTDVSQIGGAGVSDAVKVHGKTDEITSLQTEAKTTMYPATAEAKSVATNSETSNSASDSYKLSFNHAFLLPLLGFIFYTNVKHFIGNLV